MKKAMHSYLKLFFLLVLLMVGHPAASTRESSQVDKLENCEELAAVGKCATDVENVSMIIQF